jgi:O-antigen ligase
VKLRLEKLTDLLFGAAFLTLPWCGVGTLRLLSGRDWGFGLQPAWVLFYLALLLVGWRSISASGFLAGLRSFRAETGLGWALAAGLLAVLLSGLGLLVAPSGEVMSVALARFARQIVQLLLMLGFLVGIPLWLNSTGRWRLVLRLLLLGAGLQLAYSLAQGINFYFPLPPFAWLDGLFTSNPAILSGSEELYLGDAFVGIPRLRGTVCEPLYLGNFLLLAIPWAWFYRRNGRGWSLLPFGLLLLLLLTWSRGAWLALGLQLICLGLLSFWGSDAQNPGRDLVLQFRRRRVWLTGLGLLVVLVAVSVLSDRAVLHYPLDRLVQTFSTRDWSNLTRLYSMQAAWRAWHLSPLLGVGWGQYSFHFPALVDPLGLQSQFSWPVVNNFPLKILAETGLVGFLVFCTGQGIVLKRSLVRLRRESGVARRGLVIALVSALGVGVQLFTFSQYNLPHIWVAWGLLLAAVAHPGELARVLETRAGLGADDPGSEAP